MSAWVPVVVSAVEHAIVLAKSLGLPPPAADEIDKIKRAVDERLASVLPLAIVGVAASAVAVAAKAEHEIESLGHAPRCPKCDGLATQVIAHDPHRVGADKVTLSCGPCAHVWTLP